MTDQHMNGQFLTGDVGDEQQHVGTSLTANQESEAAKITGMCADGMRCGPTHCPTCPNTWLPNAGTECEARAIKGDEWCSWKPVVVRAYDGSDVWIQCPVTKESFICPVSAMDFRPTPELVPVSKGGELNKASWDDFVARLRHDCVGEGVQDHLTANAIFRVEERRIISGIDKDYTDKWVLIVEDSQYFSPKEYWDERDEEDQAELDSSAQEKHGCNFLEARESHQWDILEELCDEHTVTGWDDDWEHVNSHFTQEAADHFINTNRHNHRKGLRVYVDSQFRCYEFNTIKEAILSGKLQFVEGEQA